MKIKWYGENGKKMLVNQKEDLVYLSWEVLEKIDFIRHGFSTRFGGVSEGVCSTMNLSFTRGDKEEAVHENFARIAKAIGFQKENIVCSDQTHTTNIRIVDKDDCGKGIIKERGYTDIDGMVTNVPGVVLATFFADCVPVYLVDPVTRSIGLVHSGWRGTVDNIIKEAISVMHKTYGTNPSDIIAAIGPSICNHCYEISQDVAERFKEAYQKTQFEDMMVDHHNGKFHLDLWKACRYNLLNEGVLEKNILLPNLCTCCNPEFLFSHRASQGKRGNLAAFLEIKES